MSAGGEEVPASESTQWSRGRAPHDSSGPRPPKLQQLLELAAQPQPGKLRHGRGWEDQCGKPFGSRAVSRGLGCPEPQCPRLRQLGLGVGESCGEWGRGYQVQTRGPSHLPPPSWRPGPAAEAPGNEARSLPPARLYLSVASSVWLPDNSLSTNHVPSWRMMGTSVSPSWLHSAPTSILLARCRSHAFQTLPPEAVMLQTRPSPRTRPSPASKTVPSRQGLHDARDQARGPCPLLSQPPDLSHASPAFPS